MKYFLVSLCAAASLSAAQSTERNAAKAFRQTATFTGVITDSQCAEAGHAGMRMGPTDAECTTACVLAHGATYVLLDGSDVYALSDQKAPEPYAGRRVSVVGTLDAATRTIRVESIAAG